VKEIVGLEEEDCGAAAAAPADFLFFGGVITSRSVMS
jgi:hypothetical protein